MNMSNLDMSVTAGVKTSQGGNIITPGIHKAIFKGITKETVGQNNYNTLTITFDVNDSIEYKHRLFEPTSSERTSSLYGENPSQVEQFLLSIRHLLDAINPDAAKGIDNGTIKINGNFDQIITKLQALTVNFIGQEVELKFLPGKNGFPTLSSYPGRINKSGDLYISTCFIGHELTLTANEKVAIENAKNASPTKMNTVGMKKDDLLSDMKSDFSNDIDDDLPF